MNHDQPDNNTPKLNGQSRRIDLDRLTRWLVLGAIHERFIKLSTLALIADMPEAELADWLADPQKILNPIDSARIALTFNLRDMAQQADRDFGIDDLSEQDRSLYIELLHREFVKRSIRRSVTRAMKWWEDHAGDEPMLGDSTEQEHDDQTNEDKESNDES